MNEQTEWERHQAAVKPAVKAAWETPDAST